MNAWNKYNKVSDANFKTAYILEQGVGISESLVCGMRTQESYSTYHSLLFKMPFINDRCPLTVSNLECRKLPMDNLLAT